MFLVSFTYAINKNEVDNDEYNYYHSEYHDYNNRGLNWRINIRKFVNDYIIFLKNIIAKIKWNIMINKKIINRNIINNIKQYTYFSYTVNKETKEHWSIIKLTNVISMYCFHPMNEHWASQLLLKDLNILYSYDKSKKNKDYIDYIYSLYIISILYRK